MEIFSYIASVVFVLLLIAGVPVLSFLTARDPHLRLVPRLSLYFSAIVSQWVLTALGLLVALAERRSFVDLGLRTVTFRALYWWTLFLLVASALGMILLMLLEGLRLWPTESELVYLLLPRTRTEKLWAALAVAPTAAICEEFLYRGYLMQQLSTWTHSLLWGCLLSAAAFGLAHVYQRWSGMVRAALLGLLLAYPVLRAGTLYPSMLAHFILDAVSFVWLGAALLRDDERKRLEAVRSVERVPASAESGNGKESP